MLGAGIVTLPKHLPANAERALATEQRRRTQTLPGGLQRARVIRYRARMVQKRPHLLVTNDDSIDSHFLLALVTALLDGGFEVTIAAPMAEQSWIGRAYSRHREVHWAESHAFPCKAFALDGTPSDCVNIALGHFFPQRLPDGVVSGINLGFNCATPLLLSSGTVAGAIEGAQWGLPSAAFSLQLDKSVYEPLSRCHGDPQRAPSASASSSGGGNGNASDDLAAALAATEASLSHAARHAVTVIRHILPQPQPTGRVHNVNFPIHCDADTPLTPTRPLPYEPGTLFQPVGDSSFRFQYASRQDQHFPPDTDVGALLNGEASWSQLDLGTLGQAISDPVG